MGEFGDYFKSWNWELGFRYSRNEEEDLFGGVVSGSGLREALLDTNPATAFNPFLGFFGRNSKAAISRVYVTLHQTGEFELPFGYFTINGDLFNLPGGAGLLCGRARIPWRAVEERSRLVERHV